MIIEIIFGIIIALILGCIAGYTFFRFKVIYEDNLVKKNMMNIGKKKSILFENGLRININGDNLGMDNQTLEKVKGLRVEDVGIKKRSFKDFLLRRKG